VDSSKAIKDGKVTDGQYIKHLKCQETWKKIFDRFGKVCSELKNFLEHI
jgi:hypothetical protein